MTCDDLSVQALPEMEIVILFPYNVRPIDPFGIHVIVRAYSTGQSKTE